MLAIDFGLFVRFISREITQATSSLVSKLEIRFSILKILETQLETMVMTRIESRDARIEMQREGTVNLHLTGTVSSERQCAC